MRITRASSTPIDIRLNESVPTGAGSIGDRGGMAVTIETDDFVGVGETAPIPGQAGPKLEQLATEIGDWCRSIGSSTVDDALSGLDDHEHSVLTRFAIHTALIDLQSRANDQSASQWLRPGSATRVYVNGLIGEASPAAVHARARQLVEQGMRAIKLKVGAVDHSLDITRIVAASEAAGSNVELRLDANGAWNAETTTRIIGRVGKHRIGYIEDPTSNPSEFVALSKEIGVAIATDLDTSTNPDDAIATADVKTVVVKPAAIGGIDKLLDLSERHPEHRFIVTSSIDRDVGLAAAVHAAAALAPTSGPHGLATGRLIRNMDPGLLDTSGEVRVPAGPGIWNPTPQDD